MKALLEEKEINYLVEKIKLNREKLENLEANDLNYILDPLDDWIVAYGLTEDQEELTDEVRVAQHIYDDIYYKNENR